MGERKWLSFTIETLLVRLLIGDVWKPVRKSSHTAFEAAVTLGAGGVEIDVRKTRDGNWWCFTMQTSGVLQVGWRGPVTVTGKIKDMTWEHISQIRLPFGGHLLKAVSR